VAISPIWQRKVGKKKKNQVVMVTISGGYYTVCSIHLYTTVFGSHNIMKATETEDVTYYKLVEYRPNRKIHIHN
jgi:hypothetical protein